MALGTIAIGTNSLVFNYTTGQTRTVPTPLISVTDENLYVEVFDANSKRLVIKPTDWGYTDTARLAADLSWLIDPGDIISNNDSIEHWSLSASNILYVNPQESNPSGLEFLDNGTRLWVIGYSTNRIHEYTLSTAWDLTTATYSHQSPYLPQGGLGSSIEGFHLSPDGTKLYVLSRGSDSVAEFDLPVAFDMTAISFVQNVSYAYLDTNPTGLSFKPDGTVLYIVGYTNDDVYQVPLSTAWDISTAGAHQSFSLNEYGIGTPYFVEFNSLGTEMFVGGATSDSVNRFKLSTPWDITTASFDSESFSFRSSEETIMGFYYDDQSNKAFMCGRYTDYVREVIISTGGAYIDKTLILANSLKVNGVLETHSEGNFFGINNFRSTLNAYSTLAAYSTSRMAYVTGAGTFEVGNTSYGDAVSRFYKANYGYTPSSEANVSFFTNLTGGKGRIVINPDHTTPSYLVGGTVHIDSYANTFNHEGEFNLGGELKVTGDKPLAYRDVGLRTLGTQVVFDDFTEVLDTDINLHTPNVGSSYTSVYASAGITASDTPYVSGGNGYMRPGQTNSNDGVMYINDTVISSSDYEVRATIRQQWSGDDLFWLVIKYVDQDNFFAIAFSNSYSYCYVRARVAGVNTIYTDLRYYVNTSTSDLESIDVAIRVTGDKVSVFYEGEYRGSFTDSGIAQAGKGGFGFGAMIPSLSTGYDIHANWKISEFEIIEYPASVLDGSDSVHYIENGRVGIGTTSPTTKLHVEGTSKFVGQGTWPMKMENNKGSGQAEMGLWTVTDAYAATKNLSLVATPINNQPVWYFQGSGDGWQNITLQRYGGKVGIRTLEPSANLTVQGHGTTTGKTFLAQDSNASALFTILDSGNVGIGTTNPSQKLHVSGNARIEGDLIVNGSYTQIDTDVNTTEQWNVTNDGTGPAVTINQTGAQDIMDVQDDGTSVFYIEDGGNVGIGTTTPSYKLDVHGSTASDIISSQIGYNINLLDNPPAIDSYTLSSGTSLDVGTYYYRVVYVTSIGETGASPHLLVTTTTGNTTVNLSGIPISSDSRVTARKLYRTKVGATNDNQYFLATINDNTTTTYVDNTPDGSLTGANSQAYKINTTSKFISTNNTQALILDNNLTALGLDAGRDLIANNSAAVRTVLIGKSAGQRLTTGKANVIVGQAGSALTTGGSNTIIGDLALYAGISNSSTVIIGSQTARFLTSGNNSVIIGGSSVRNLVGGGNVTNTSNGVY